MARNFVVGDKVFVPVAKFPALQDIPSVFWETNVISAIDRSIEVQLRNGATSWIATSKCHKNIGFLILTVGDLQTETTLLDPLAKSILQYCRLLVPDDFIRSIKVRSLKELERIWMRDHPNYSHVVFIGHGSQNGFHFANDGWCDSSKLEEVLTAAGVTKKIFISLCCQSGHQPVGGKLSEKVFCSHFLAPFHSIHGATASQFAQTFLAFHLLEGETVGVAFRHTVEGTPGTKTFRLWENGKLKAGPKK